jgi:hypothetical protein
MTAAHLALVAEPLPGVEGTGITTAEIIAVACVVVILIVVAAWVYWRR